MVKNILTIDVEEYFEEASSDVASGCSSRIEEQIDKCLQLLQDTNNSATFFFLARIAVQFPHLPRKVISSGHEVASHGFNHVYFDGMPIKEQITQFRRSIREIENIIGEKVIGFRAPYFSINASNKEIMQKLVEEGLKYDSSIFPGYHPYYGWRATKSEPYIIEFPENKQLVEIPPSTFSFCGFRAGVAGGGYLRMYPYMLTSMILNRKSSAGKPIVIYFHPWELDPEQPRLKLKLRFPFRHYANLNTTEKKLKKIFASNSFSPCREILQQDLPKIPFAQLGNCK